MSANKQLQAVARERVGKGAAREARRQGLVPAVIYGGNKAPTAISIDFKLAKKLIFSGHFLTTVFDIEVDGKKEQVIPRDYQLDVVRDFPIHIDFLRLAAGQEISVEVPLHVVDQETAPGLKQGGTLQLVAHTIELTVPSNAIPDSVEVSIASLEIGGVIHLKDVKLPKGAKASLPEDATLLSIVPPVGAEEEPAAATEGEAEAAKE
ncbi:50S ribosomal protein L25/general stress protein Ctc [Microvirga sp. W0021]|uniref:Large ribosomal subunit protein bL25 n=1 Tax=Hohaiivirga grylli TaxID=3133970 RepID=A0ABV0BJV4_9HYPH